SEFRLGHAAGMPHLAQAVGEPSDNVGMGDPGFLPARHKRSPPGTSPKPGRPQQTQQQDLTHTFVVLDFGQIRIRSCAEESVPQRSRCAREDRTVALWLRTVEVSCTTIGSLAAGCSALTAKPSWRVGGWPNRWVKGKKRQRAWPKVLSGPHLRVRFCGRCGTAISDLPGRSIVVCPYSL